jgi:hypothetical protein
VVPNLTSSIAHAMGFTLPSNFFFAIATGALALLHVHTLVTLSRTELRSITLTQELGLLREKLDRVAQEDTAPPAIGVPPAGQSTKRAAARHERT